MKKKILVVDDEPKLVTSIRQFLEKEDFDVITATDGQEAIDLALQHKPTLILLDWMLPKINGIDVCQILRRQGSFGIIMLTARNDAMDKILGLEIGADDYITKPFHQRELLARIRSVLRRIQGEEVKKETIYKWKDLVIDTEKYKVYKNGVEIALTPTEFKILATLAAKPGIVYSRLQLLEIAMDDEFIIYERTVDSHISNLRKKLGDQAGKHVYIQTVYGFGYRLGDPL